MALPAAAHDVGRRPHHARDRGALPGAAGRVRARPAARSCRRGSRASAALERVLSFDMGGTTAKICLIDQGEPERARAFEVARAYRNVKGSGLPVRIPVIEMVEIGAGGGSIARVDAMQRITVGPDSAGADPGPACYGRGGTRADGDRRRPRAGPHRSASGSPTARSRSTPRPPQRALATHVGAPLGARGAVARGGRVGDRRGEHGQRRARARDRARQGDRPLHDDRVRRRRAAARGPARREARRAPRGRVPSGASVGSAIGFLRAPVSFEVVRSHRAHAVRGSTPAR